ncbi:DUF3299 domain-containing protein [Gynuella sunshinyii]|uniref:DUF3299 domain-containing protein n=1 Tax=Gynuella sunshinyii YC6258 TaxID=1445510 RepID=A0A0C5VRW3_9GAMM|nr:DUF3299 domain-containing protein [Gynuella sunshinyii]AJQ96971.1 hypothetical protein YC6258_04939 [Gynuella sunshinyii YC6258]
MKILLMIFTMLLVFPAWAAGENTGGLSDEESNYEPAPQQVIKPGRKGFREVSWDDLIPADFDLSALENKILQKYDINKLSDESSDARKLYQELQDASKNAPVVKELDGDMIKIPGFVVPLDMTEDKIRTFLLVPYYGACIHTPPPPSNQIIFVDTQEAFKLGNTFDPVWVSGMVQVQTQDSDLGTAGYTVYAQKIEPYL